VGFCKSRRWPADRVASTSFCHRLGRHPRTSKWIRADTDARQVARSGRDVIYWLQPVPTLDQESPSSSLGGATEQTRLFGQSNCSDFARSGRYLEGGEFVTVAAVRVIEADSSSRM
jgi:hypothetical protein